MQFSVNSGDLASALAWVSRALAPRPPVAVLNGIKISVANERLSLTAFDYEQSAISVLSLASGSEDGDVVVPGRLLNDIVKALPKGDVDVVLDGSRVRLTAGSAKFTLPTLGLDEYPSLPAVPGIIATVDAPEFATAVRQVAVATGSDATAGMVTFTAVSMTLDPDGTMTLAGTDRYRLAVRRLTVPQVSLDEPVTLLVPSKALEGYAKALSGDGQVHLRAQQGGESTFGVSGTTNAATSRLIDGEYPKYQRLLPEAFAAEAKVDSATLADVVKRMKLVAHASTVRLSFEAGQLNVSAGRDDESSASEYLDVDYQGEPISIAFNHDYLLDGIQSVASDVTLIRLNSSTKPAVLAPADGNADYTYLIMPVRLSG